MLQQQQGMMSGSADVVDSIVSLPSQGKQGCSRTPKISFLDLPKELRQEIYRYAVVTRGFQRLRLWQGGDVRSQILERKLPTLCYALPLFRQEILEVYYRYNTFSMRQGNDRLLVACFRKWLRNAGSVATKEIRHLIIECKSGPRYPDGNQWKVDIRLNQAFRIEVEWTRFCRNGCDNYTLEQTEGLLSCRDFADDISQARLMECVTYSPVLQVAVQRVEVVRLRTAFQRRLEHRMKWTVALVVAARIAQSAGYRSAQGLQKIAKTLLPCHNASYRCRYCRWRDDWLHLSQAAAL
jgi:hypothetical protein